MYYIMFCYDIIFFNDTATTEIYTLSLHDALPIFPRSRPIATAISRWCSRPMAGTAGWSWCRARRKRRRSAATATASRSEEHTSELQSLAYLVCRLLLEKKKKHTKSTTTRYKKQND